MSLNHEHALAPTDVTSGWQKRRTRFIAVSVAGLSVLAAALGVSFLGDTGTTDVSVAGTSSNFVFPVGTGNAVPSGVAALKNTPDTGIVSGSYTAPVQPAWTPSAGSAGAVTTAGDLAVLDASTSAMGAHTSLRVNMYVTNLEALQRAYSSFALPVNIYRCASSCDTTSSWSQASSVVAGPPTYLTNTDGFLSFSLPAGYFYDVTLDTGGSFYTVSTGTASNLGPKFYFTGTAI